MTQTADTVSAADIVFRVEVPPESSVVLRFDLDAVLHDVRHTLRRCGTSNRNDQLAIANKALIAADVDTQPRIIGAAKRLGFSTRHAAVILGRGGGGAWRLDASGIYRLVHGCDPG